MSASRGQVEAMIERWYAAAVAAVEPANAVDRYLRRQGDRLILDGKSLTIDGRLIVIAVGKAAMAMARAVAGIADGLIDAGIVLTKDGHVDGALPSTFSVLEAAHPIPDERGVEATTQILRLLSGLRAGDVVLALISGGGSALLEAPRPPVTLADFARITDSLLRAGAPIEDLNAVRRPLSQVKAGGLLRVAAPASVYTVILSDVLGNDPRIIASGPTVPGRPDAAGALATLDRYGVRESAPASVVEMLESLRASPPGDEVEAAGVVLLGDNNAAVDAARAAVVAGGLLAEIVLREAVGEAAALAKAWVERCRQAASNVDVLLGGGEATVTVRGDGVGGRNTEFALAAALALAELRMDGWAVASLATDGEDGPTGAAGAIATAKTIARAMALGIDPTRALAENDSLRVFEAAGGVVRPGPTGTNVNDLYFAVRLSSPSR